MSTTQAQNTAAKEMGYADMNEMLNRLGIDVHQARVMVVNAIERAMLIYHEEINKEKKY